ncbi:hypothetical protein D3C76_204630 [compost metagenome]
MYEWIKNYSLVEYSDRVERLDFREGSRFHMERLKLESPSSGMTAARAEGAAICISILAMR